MEFLLSILTFNDTAAALLIKEIIKNKQTIITIYTYRYDLYRVSKCSKKHNKFFTVAFLLSFSVLYSGCTRFESRSVHHSS
jgi:hypothetical protein